MTAHIFKYSLGGLLGEPIKLQLPNNFAICDINHQGENVFMWATVDIHAPLEQYEFIIYGTGWKINNIDNLFFMKTVHMPNGLVFHVFSIIESTEEIE